ncbi:FKBP-type peptidyl-prolyl cis-trans isomerase [uncultured Maricaulis sp.]|uniref:FKBP-type peptidyl-prolyl cis-trans isomerase n=1 Tax=uncultured Maricaulis sp. TaxID=174710 RepID=UPI0030DC359A|tara:strand:+ start:7003 stop:7671 length:669 start_codon:yes stop_codon:yes gene_type:complete
MKLALLTTAALALTLAACSNGSSDVSDTSSTEAPATSETSAAPDAATPAAPVVDTAERAIVAEARTCVGAADTAILVGDAPADGNQDAEVNAAAATAYLDAVRAEPCVFELPSGLLFRIRQPVNAGISPVSGDLVTVHYRGMFTYGGEFDSSYARGEPATFPSDRLIAGWVEALPLMRVGEAWDLFIAPDLAYGSRGTPGGPIGPDEALVFQLELIDVPGGR